MRKVFIDLEKHYSRTYIAYCWLISHKLKFFTIFVNLFLYGGLLLDYLVFKMRKFVSIMRHWYAIWTTFDGLSDRS